MSVLSDVLDRVRSVLFRAREERELAEELRFHVEMETELNRRAGMSEIEAHRHGAMALGGVERTKEDVRDARGTQLLDDTVADFRFTFRALARSPGFTVVAILTLGIGIGGTTAVYSAVDAVLLQPLPYEQPGELVRLYQHDTARPADEGYVTPVHMLEYRQRMASFAASASVLTYSESGADIGSGDRARRIRLLPVSAEYFDVVRTPPERGRAFTRGEEADAPVVILSHALAGELPGGAGSAVGQSLTMNARAYTVVGVMPASFVNPLGGPSDAWVPQDLSEGRSASNADNHYLDVIARLKSGVSIKQAQAELDVLSLALAKQYPTASRLRARLLPLKEDIVGPSSRALAIMLGAVGLVLVLVCVNMANLLLVRATERAREFALRSALGADRSRLVRQLLIESLVLALAGDVAGLVVARLAMSAITAFGAGSIPRLATLALEPRLLVFSVAVASLSAIGFGLAPALRAARTEPTDTLREQGRTATGGRVQVRLREWLVVVQLALAFVLLVGAGLLVESVRRIRDVDLGVRPEGVLVFDLHLPSARYDSTARARLYETLAMRLAELPGVRAAGGISRLPANGPFHEWGTTALTGPLVGTRDANGSAQQRVVSGGYFAATGIKLVEGRAFDSRDGPGTPWRVVVSRSFAARFFPGVSAVGQFIEPGSGRKEIIGVVGDVGLDAEGRAARYVYHAHTQFAGDRNWALTQVVKTTGPIALGQASVRRAIADLDPELVMFRPMTLAEAIGRSEAQRAFTMGLLSSFAAVALAVASLGLYGVLAYGVRLRTREFGIRMALGAERGAIRRMVLRQGLSVTAIGIAAGGLGALVLARVMGAMVFHVSALEPAVLGGAMLLLGVVAAIAAWVPARRATSVDPRTALQ
ncbi:MAG: ABC transporter permease [Gemmatimonadales bacterium]